MKNTDCIYTKDAGKNKIIVSEQIVKRVNDTLNFYNMFDGIRGVVVAFSGGADSTALLDILTQLSARHGTPGICAFHVNHGIRGLESDADEEHCRLFCAERNIPFASVRIDVPSESALCGTGIEETARRMRYDELFSCCVEQGYDCIATAHHADDNLETLLFRITRGTGMRGLCGIPPMRTERGIRIVRPLIRLSRNEIENYLSVGNLSYVADSTNRDVNYSRNRIRELVIPELRKINPSVHVSATRLTEQISDFFSFTSEPENGNSRAVERANQFRTFELFEKYREFAEKNLGYVPMLENVHIDALNRLFENKKLWSAVSLPGNISAVWTRSGIEWRLKKKDTFNTKIKEAVTAYSEIIENMPLGVGWNFFEKTDGNGNKKISLILFGYNKTGSSSERDKSSTLLSFGEDMFLNGKSFSGKKDVTVGLLQSDILSKIKKGIINIYKLSIYTEVNSAKLSGSVFVRYRMDGDRIKHNNMTKKVKKMLQENNVPPYDRDVLPFVCDDEGVVWIPGVALRDGVCAKVRDENTLTLCYIDCEQSDLPCR